MRRLMWPVGTGMTVLCLTQAAVAAVAITRIPSLSPPDGTNHAWGISADGTTVVGNSDTPSPLRGFRWTAGTGSQDLGFLYPEVSGITTTAYATNADGTVVVGSTYEGGAGSGSYRWTVSGGMQSLGFFGGISSGVVPRGVSANGSVIVGTGLSGIGNGNGNQAFRWTTGGGFQNLGMLPGAVQANGQAVSADGAVVVGSSGTAGALKPFRWTTESGMQSLGLLPGGTTASAVGVSGDGSIVAGFGSTPAGNRAFRWTEAGGFQTLSLFPTATATVAAAISVDGLTVVGYSDASGGNRATLWNPQLGAVDLNSYLASLGVDLTGWRLTNATGVSADGMTICGWGYYDFRISGWVATIPSPTTGVFMSLGATFVLGRRRRL